MNVKSPSNFPANTVLLVHRETILRSSGSALMLSFLNFAYLPLNLSHHVVCLFVHRDVHILLLLPLTQCAGKFDK